MNNPKISIIIPVYNTEEYLEECFDSILAQTYQNFEVIVVDDGSTDNSGSICDEYAHKDERFKIIHKENGGVSSARNAALDVVTGDYVGFVDSDDTILPGMLEEYVTIANNNRAEIIQSVDARSNRKADNSTKATVYLFYNDEARREFFTIKKVRPSLWLGIYLSDLIGDVRFPDNIHQWEDYAFIGVLVSKANIVAITTNCYYQYREREGSATRRPLNDKNLSCILIDDYLDGYGVYKTKQEKYDVIGFFVRCCTINYLASPPDDREKYKKYIREYVKENMTSLKNCKSVALREKLIVVVFQYSVLFAKCLRIIISSGVKMAISIRDMLK